MEQISFIGFLKYDILLAKITLKIFQIKHVKDFLITYHTYCALIFHFYDFYCHLVCFGI